MKRTLAVALAVLVVLAGCSAFTAQNQTDESSPVDFSNTTEAREALVAHHYAVENATSYTIQTESFENGSRTNWDKIQVNKSQSRTKYWISYSGNDSANIQTFTGDEFEETNSWSVYVSPPKPLYMSSFDFEKTRETSDKTIYTADSLRTDLIVMGTENVSAKLVVRDTGMISYAYFEEIYEEDHGTQTYTFNVSEINRTVV